MTVCSDSALQCRQLRRTDICWCPPQGGYVPPSVRNRGAAGMGDSMHRREENSVRVTNLSEDTREEDLRVSHQILGLLPDLHASWVLAV